MKAELISVGTELLLGQIVDTNAAYLASELPALGIDCYYVSQVGDNLDRLVDTLRRAAGAPTGDADRRPGPHRGRPDP